MKNTITRTFKENNMKKSVLILAMAVVLTVAFAASAFASPTGYIAWDSAYNYTQKAVLDDSPHANYVLTTEKCQVCHAPHRAAEGGELLLRSDRAGACTFCHIDQGVAGLVQVYEGLAVNYETESANAHNDAMAPCSGCHAVHSAGTLTDSDVSGLILKNLSGVAASGAGNLTSNAPASNTSATDRDVAITYFCAQCHQYYTTGAGNNNTIANNELMDNATGTYAMASYASHPMVADDTYAAAYENGTRAALPAGQGAGVATTESLYCRSCHDSGTDGTDAMRNLDSTTVGGTNAFNLGASFPHYTPGAEFLNVATGDGGAISAAASGEADGVCLKCHNDGTSGVSMTF